VPEASEPVLELAPEAAAHAGTIDGAEGPVESIEALPVAPKRRGGKGARKAKTAALAR
jgi:hypothetical protein